jgi:hypothetical protein
MVADMDGAAVLATWNQAGSVPDLVFGSSSLALKVFFLDHLIYSSNDRNAGTLSRWTA